MNIQLLQAHPVTGIYFSLPLCPHWVQTLPVAVAIYSQANKDYLSERWITRWEVSPLALGWQRGRRVEDLEQGLAEIGHIDKNNHILAAHVREAVRWHSGVTMRRWSRVIVPPLLALAPLFKPTVFVAPQALFTTIIWRWIQINTTPCGPLQYKKRAVVLCRPPSTEHISNAAEFPRELDCYGFTANVFQATSVSSKWNSAGQYAAANALYHQCSSTLHDPQIGLTRGLIVSKHASSTLK